MSPVLAFTLVLIALTLIVCGSMFFRFRPHRRCPRCRSMVDISRWRCKFCGYRFDEVNLHSH
jgi:predicted Zn-ribbon and HTH transcriptional regulator